MRFSFTAWCGSRRLIYRQIGRPPREVWEGNMLKKTKARLEKVERLIAGGDRISDACRKAGLNATYYHELKRNGRLPNGGGLCG